mmetsp:Transcript_5514/g.18239  ORF Transcript_5514/g.18239 Transcript_5514/m.18239 type:complete len:266 (-) Transcript_5514:1498-2295(-)
MSPRMPSRRDVLPLPTGPSTTVRVPLLSCTPSPLSVGGLASAMAASDAAASCAASARAVRVCSLSREPDAPLFIFLSSSLSSFVPGHRKAASCSSMAATPMGAGRRERKVPSICSGGPSEPGGGRLSRSTASRGLALRKLERRVLMTLRLMTRAIMSGTTSSGKRMILKREREVKAVAAVSLLPSAEYMRKVASVTKMGTAVKKNPITPPRRRLFRTCLSSAVRLSPSWPSSDRSQAKSLRRRTPCSSSEVNLTRLSRSPMVRRV